MKKCIPSWISICLVFQALSVNGQLDNDVRFYNLEKEYKPTQTFIYPVKNANPLELKLIISTMLSIYGSLYVNEQHNEIYITDVPEKIEDITPVLSRLDVQELKMGNNLKSSVIQLKHDRVDELIAIIRHKLSSEGSLYSIPSNNAVVITDIPSKIEEIENFITLIDLPAPHVNIQIIALEYNNEKFSENGINIWNWIQNVSIQADLYGVNLQTMTDVSKITVKSSEDEDFERPRELSSSNFKAKPQHYTVKLGVSDIVRLICDSADGSVLVNTQLVTRNNKSASIRGYERIYTRYTETDWGAKTTSENPYGTGLWMTVKPTILSDSIISMIVHPVINDLTGWTPKGRPIVFERELNTEVRVKENDVFVLGGLRRKEKIKLHKGIPLLKNIPVLGFFFGVKKDIVVEREVVILIKPTFAENKYIDQRDILLLNNTPSDNPEKDSLNIKE